MNFNLNRGFTNMENFLALVNSELKKLNVDITLTEEDIDITSPEVISDPDGEWNTKVVISNKEGKEKLSRPINFIYKRVSVHEQLEIEDPDTESVVLQVHDDIWSDGMDETNAEVVLSEQLDFSFQTSCFNLEVTKVSEDRYDVVQTAKDGLDNLLYTGKITWNVIREGTII